MGAFSFRGRKTKSGKMKTMKARTILLVWLVIFFAFGAYGFGRGLSNQRSYSPFDWKDALEPTITFAAVGLCFGAYLSIGLVILKLVRREQLYRVWAVLLLAFLGTLAIPGPTAIVLLAEKATVSGIRLYQKELFYFPILFYYIARHHSFQCSKSVKHWHKAQTGVLALYEWPIPAAYVNIDRN
jgi:hypothetical protein